MDLVTNSFIRQAFIFLVIVSLSVAGMRALLGGDATTKNDASLEARHEALARDTAGGRSAEETFKLFVDALERRDALGASRYFILDAQDEMHEKLSSGFSAGVMPELVALLRGPKKLSKLSDQRYQYAFAVEESHFTIDIVLNPLSATWKLEAF